MSTPLETPDIQRIRFIVLAVNSRSAYTPNYNPSNVYGFQFYFRNPSNSVLYHSNYATASSYYSSYTPYRFFDTNYSTYWEIASAQNYSVAIPSDSKQDTWEKTSDTHCWWAEGDFGTPVPYADFLLNSGGRFFLYAYNYAYYSPTHFVVLGQDLVGEWHVLVDRSATRVLLENYSSTYLDVEGVVGANGSENEAAIKTLQLTSSGAALASNWFMYVKDNAIAGTANVGLGLASSGFFNTGKPASIHGRIHEVSNSFRSSIWGGLTYPYEFEASIYSKVVSDLSLGILGALYNNRGCAITGGDTFGSRYLIPLTDKIPLRLSCVWGEYKTVKAIPHLYGNTSVSPIPYGTTNKQFVIADHAIHSVQEVYVNDVRVNSYEFLNTSDNTGHAIALLSFVDTKETSDEIRVVCQGKIHPRTGGMLLNPAEILWDILANISGLEITENDLAYFRDTCYQLGIESHGGLIDANKTIRSQIDEVMLSVGGIWSGGMKGIAKVYPFSEVI